MKNFALKVPILLFVSQFLILILLRFRGNYHSFYINAYNYFLDSTNFKYDLFLNNSLLFNSTIYYKFLSFLSIEKETDFILFFIYLILIFINLYFYIRIIKEFYNPNNKWAVALYIIPASVLGNFLAPNAESALIYSHTGTGTQIAFTTMLLMIFFTLKHKWKLAFLFGIISLLLASKHSAFPFFVSITYFLTLQVGYRTLIKIYLILGLILSLLFTFIFHGYLKKIF